MHGSVDFTWRRLRLGFLIVALGAVVTALAYAAPVRAMTGELRGVHGAAPARPAAVSGVPTIFGVDEGGVLTKNAQAASLAAASGVSRTRVEISWANLEPQQGSYNFAMADNAINQLVNAGLEPVVYVAETPAWAGPVDCGPIDTNNAALVAAFENTMGVLANRYPNVKIWALYNEVDATHGGGAGCFGSSGNGMNNNGVEDYKEYAIMLAAAWRGVHASNPNALLASGAVAYDNFKGDEGYRCPPNYPGNCQDGGFNYKFLPNLFKYIKDNPQENNAQYLDMVLYNYYDIYGRYWETVAKGRGIQAKAAAIRKLMKTAGLPKVALFVTETGEDSGWIGEKNQARCLQLEMVRGAAAKLKGVVWWTFRDFPDNAPPPQNTWKYGLVKQDLTPKPAYVALQTLVAQLEGYNYRKKMSDRPGFENIEAYKFENNGAAKIFVMSSLHKSSSYKPECSWPRYTRTVTFRAKALEVVSYLGQVTSIADNSKKDKDKTPGKIAIKVGKDPKIVRINP